MLDSAVPAAQWRDGRRREYRWQTGQEQQAIQGEMQRLLDLVRRGPLGLDRFCSPLACHGDVIGTLLEELAVRSAAAWR